MAVSRTLSLRASLCHCCACLCHWMRAFHRGWRCQRKVRRSACPCLPLGTLSAFCVFTPPLRESLPPSLLWPAVFDCSLGGGVSPRLALLVPRQGSTTSTEKRQNMASRQLAWKPILVANAVMRRMTCHSARVRHDRRAADEVRVIEALQVDLANAIHVPDVDRCHLAGHRREQPARTTTASSTAGGIAPRPTAGGDGVRSSRASLAGPGLELS